MVAFERQLWCIEMSTALGGREIGNAIFAPAAVLCVALGQGIIRKGVTVMLTIALRGCCEDNRRSSKSEVFVS